MMTLLQEAHENSRSHADFNVDVNAQVYFVISTCINFSPIWKTKFLNPEVKFDLM